MHNVCTILQTTKWGTLVSSGNPGMHNVRTYAPFHQLRNGQLPIGDCTVSSENFCVCNVCMIIYHFTNYRMGDFPVSLEHFHECDVRIISSSNCQVGDFLIFLCA